MAGESLRQSGVYVIRNTVNGKVYVGSAVDVAKRWKCHRWQLANGKHHSRHLQGAWRKYGESAFAFDLINPMQPAAEEARVDFQARLIDVEQWFIDKLCAANSANGYNISPTAGSTRGKPCRIDTRMKIGIANRGRKQSQEACEKKRRYANSDAAHLRYVKWFRPDHLRSRVSISKGGSGIVLSAQQIAEAIAEYESGTISTKRLARKYGVSYAQMWNATRGAAPKFGEEKVDLGRVSCGFDDIATRNKIARTLRVLSDEQVAEVRRLYASGEMYQREIGELFGVSQTTIYRIVRQTLLSYKAG